MDDLNNSSQVVSTNKNDTEALDSFTTQKFLAHYQFNYHKSEQMRDHLNKLENYVKENYDKKQELLARSNLTTSNSRDIPEEASNINDRLSILKKYIQNEGKLINENITKLASPNEELDRAKHKDLNSHRLIEKRRRDRFNSQLERLKAALPTNTQRKGKMRMEKSEVIEIAINYIEGMKRSINENNFTSFSQTRNENTSEAIITDKDTGCDSTNGEYSIGFTDGMNCAIKYFKKLNELEKKNNEVLVQKFKNHAIKKVAENSLNVNKLIEETLQSKKEYLSEFENSDLLPATNSGLKHTVNSAFSPYIPVSSLDSTCSSSSSADSSLSNESRNSSFQPLTWDCSYGAHLRTKQSFLSSQLSKYPLANRTLRSILPKTQLFCEDELSRLDRINSEASHIFDANKSIKRI